MSAKLYFLSAKGANSLRRTILVTVRLTEGVAMDALEAPVVIKAVVELSPEAAGRPIELPYTGSYVVELSFPSGAIVRRSISVRTGESHKFLVHERLNEVTGRRVGMPRRPIPADGKTWKRSPMANNEFGGMRVWRLDSLRLSPTGQSLTELWRSLPRLLWSWPHRKPSTYVPFSASTDEVRLPIDSSPTAATYPSLYYEREWLIVAQTGAEMMLLSIPNGWNDHNRIDQPLYLAGFGPVANHNQRRSTAQLKLIDPYFGSLIEFLALGNFDATDALTKDIDRYANQALFEKNENPFAAAAGAYVYALAIEPRGAQISWMRNLYYRFDWLPDGRIALGWKLLRSGQKGSDEWNEARQCFRSAALIGIPFFTIGLRVLIDGLSLLSMADPDDVEIASLLSWSTDIYLASAVEEPFTTIYLRRRAGRPFYT